VEVVMGSRRLLALARRHVEQVADVTEAREGPENVVLLQGGGASALKSEHESVLRESGHRVAGFAWSVRVYLYLATSHICLAAHNICEINIHIS
jgi:hypothetical protein